MAILNLAGPDFDLGNVLFAVLQELEHRRRAFEPDQARDKLAAAARDKLAEIHESYREAGGTASYWEVVEREVLDTSLPQYLAGALEQNRLERESYGTWRGGDPLSRILFGLGGLTLGTVLYEVPLTSPVVDLPALVVLTASGILYPEVKRLYHDWRHSRLLNRLVIAAEAYQKDPRIHYVSTARLEEELRTAGEPPLPAATAAARRREPAADGEPPPSGQPGGDAVRPRSRT